MKDSPIFKNSYFSVLQTVAMAISALLLFKLMVMEVGLKVTGLWSYLSSITAITSFGSFGFANALLYYIPKYQIEDDTNKVKNLINTTFFSVLVFTTILCFLAFTIFTYIIPVTVSTELVNIARNLLPIVVGSFFFSALSTSYLSVLDGLMLMHIRSKINIAGSFIFLVGGFILLLSFGIIGIPIAQLIQNIFLLVTAFIAVKKHIPSYKFSLGFDKKVSRNIFKYGFNFQLISITQIVSEPFMKAMITKYSGSDLTAIFDFCVKLLSVFRSLIISANQTIVPQITIFKALGKKNRILVFYKANFRLVLLLSLLFFLAPIVLTDTLSIFFLNKTSNDFNFVLFNVSFALLINAIAFPAHFHYLGLGQLKWNVINNIVTAFLIFISAPIVGELVGGKYVIMCWSISAIIGSSILITAFNKENGLSIFPYFDKNIILIIVAMAIAIVFNQYLNDIPAIKNSQFAVFCTNIIVLVLVLFYPAYKNTTLKKIKDRLSIKYSK